MKISPEECEIIFKGGESVGRFLGRNGNCDFVHLSLAAESEIPSHIQDIPVTFLVASGKPTLVTEKSEYDLEGGNAMFVPANIPRAWRNRSNKPATLFVVRHLENQGNQY